MNTEKTARSDWQRPLDEMAGDSTSCPKCGLEFDSMLFNFCRHKECPVRDFKRKRAYHEKGDDMAVRDVSNDAI